MAEHELRAFDHIAYLETEIMRTDSLKQLFASAVSVS